MSTSTSVDRVSASTYSDQVDLDFTTKNSHNKSIIKSLSISGGGIRSIMATEMVEKIVERVGNEAHEIFDLFVGTSAGALATAGYLIPDPDDLNKNKYKASQVTELFETSVKKIFSPSQKSGISSLWGVLGPKYSSAGMEKELLDLCGETKLENMLKDVWYPVFNGESFTDSAFYFTRKAARQDPTFKDVLLRDVLQAATAAPGYFDAKTMKLGDQKVDLVDGGLFINNPSPHTFTEACELFDCGSHQIVLSLGTGSVNCSIKEMPKWGFANWAPYILDSIFSGQNADGRNMTAKLLNKPGQPRKFYEIQHSISKDHSELDNALDSNIKYLKERPQIWLDDPKNNDMFEELCNKLKVPERD